MTTPASPDPQRGSGLLRRLPLATWIGIGSTALLALIGLASGGVWSMVLMAALVVLITAIYGLIFRRSTWLKLPRSRTAGALGVGIALAILLGSSGAYAATHPTTTAPAGVTGGVATTSTPTATPTPTPTPVVTTKLVAETAPVPFQTTTVQSASLPEGTSSVTTAGVNGVETKTYLVTYSDGVETNKALQSDTVTPTGDATDNSRDARRTRCSDMHERHVRQQCWQYRMPPGDLTQCAQRRSRMAVRARARLVPVEYERIESPGQIEQPSAGRRTQRAQRLAHALARNHPALR